MKKITFWKAGQTRKFLVEAVESCGWEVRDEQDSCVIRRIRTRDWQRVERALLAFSVEAKAAGWNEA